VCGRIDGRIAKFPEGERLEFTWDGNDECDPAFGSGRLMLKEGEAEGEFKFHRGDISGFKTRRMGGKRQ